VSSLLVISRLRRGILGPDKAQQRVGLRLEVPSSHSATSWAETRERDFDRAEPNRCQDQH
ncbi:hypothetical protein P7K49_010074, partial [Saguinus oedipus]